MIVFILWVVLCFVVASIGSGRKIGFGPAFFASLFLSPLVGLVLVLVSKSRADEAYKAEVLDTQKKQKEALEKLSGAEAAPVVSLAEELEKLQNLRDRGVITHEEFLALKHRLIGN
jgi:hypothetical protein